MKNNQVHKIRAQKAAEEGNAVLLEHALNAGVDPNSTFDEGQSLLHISARSNRRECVTVLVSRDGIKVNIRNAYGETPLHLAVEEDASDAIAALTAHKASWGVVDNRGMTPMQLRERRVFHEEEMEEYRYSGLL